MDWSLAAQELVFGAARWSGLNFLLRRASRRALLVVCYHAVVPDEELADPYRSQLAVGLTTFDWQLRRLCRHFSPVSVDDVLAACRDGRKLPPNPVLVTFDDGFRNNLTYAAPQLQRAGVPAVVFLTTGHIGSQRLLWTQELQERVLNWPTARLPMPIGSADAELAESAEGRMVVVRHLRELCKTLAEDDKNGYLDRLRGEPRSAPSPGFDCLYRFLNWDEVRQLHRLGIALGSHTVSHPILAKLTPAQLDWELVESKSAIERELGVSCHSIAYPNGRPCDVSNGVLHAVKKAGYSLGFFFSRQKNWPPFSPLEIDRVGMDGRMSVAVMDAHNSGFHARLMRWTGR